MEQIRLAVVVALLLLAAVIIGQNTEVVSVRLLFWELTMSRILLLGGTIFLGFAAGFVTAKVTGRPGRAGTSGPEAEGG